MRVIVVSMIGDRANAEPRLDAQIRVGGDAGASEVIVLRAYGETAIERREPRHRPAAAGCAGRRRGGRAKRPRSPRTSADRPDRASAASRMPPTAAEPARVRWHHLGETLRPGRHRLRLDPAHPVARAARRGPRPAAVRADHAVEVHGAPTPRRPRCSPPGCSCSSRCRPSACSAHRRPADPASTACSCIRASGAIELERDPDRTSPRLVQPNQPAHDISLPRRNLRDCLAEELRRLDPDDLYGEVIRTGLDQLSRAETGGGSGQHDDRSHRACSFDRPDIADRALWLNASSRRSSTFWPAARRRTSSSPGAPSGSPCSRPSTAHPPGQHRLVAGAPLVGR